MNVVLPVHSRNKYREEVGRSVKRIRDKAIKITLSETKISPQCRMLQQSVCNHLKGGAPVIIRTQNIQIRRANLKVERVAYKT